MPPAVENYIYVGQNPYSMTFDPFGDLARRRQPERAVDGGHRDAQGRAAAVSESASNRYRFAYVGIFTQSYVQMIDLDDSAVHADTFEQVVFNLGMPTIPKGQANNNNGSFL